MVEFVKKNVVTPSSKNRNNAQVYLKTGAVAKGSFFANKFCQLVFKFDMNIECSVKKPRACTSRSVFVNCPFCSFLDFRMVGKTKVTVRSKHQHILSSDFDNSVLV